MLSEQSVPLVRATLPAIGGALGEITERFYGNMFAAHPELLRDLFNRGNQASGSQKQALAGAIAGFATMLVERPGTRPDVLLSRIAHKHASLGITSEQYKIVHRHLFDAIAGVLGDAVTPEVAAAWDEVYWLMANALIALEARLYEKAGAAEGEVWRPMRVISRREETPDVVSITLVPADGEPTGTFLPGQYVSVQAELPDGARQIRQYSLSHGPGNTEWRISVKKVDGTTGPAGEVSSWLHKHLRAGDTLRVSAPFGGLTLPDGDGSLLLASAGIGTTPMLSMLHALAASESTRRVIIAHADRSPADHAHRDELVRLVKALPKAECHLWYETPDSITTHTRTGRTDLGVLDLPENLTAYLCGPLPYLRAIRSDLLHHGVPAAGIHYEVFGPDLWLGQD
ncbi:FAD-binding oxidoreductase [Streptomyces sp. NBC_01142]|uniref:globin domain-containing protein n=1 Tax=Streptomyces sp. NBC_01142 TaxID=2975865 RepID=UPI00225C125C|nr:globin domain-containing protein [Streptomyces sp. NBC_01142]MCX4825843.1 FAD-binding oxidoreductase [Streptomyces sp. NBC_01142]